MTEEQQQPTPEQAEEANAPYFVAKTKEQYEAEYGTRAQRAKDKARKDLLERFGVENEDDLEEIVSDYQAIQEATQTETQILEEKAQKAENARKSLKENLQQIEAERDQAKERTETLEQLVAGFVTPRLEQLPEHYRELLDEWPVEKQAGWLTKNADKLTETNGNGNTQRPAGSRPTGRPQVPPRAEADKEAREQQRQARVSAI
jgi:hypothetical protein